MAALIRFKCFLAITLAISLSCSSGPLIETKVEIEDTAPDIDTFAYQLKRTQKKGRSIASVGGKYKKTQLSHLNNRRLYFVTLLAQYKSFARILGRPAGMANNCPRFHSDVLNTKSLVYRESKRYQNVRLSTKSVNKQNSALYPEYFLELESNRKDLTLLSESRNKGKEDRKYLLLSALNTHFQTVEKEIGELCEYGQSANYYIFENMMTYIKNHHHFLKSKKAANTLFKSSVFSNMAILRSLSREVTGRSPASTHIHPFEQELGHRTGATELEGYFNEMIRRR